MANRLYAANEALNPFDQMPLVASSDTDINNFIGGSITNNNRVYSNLQGTRNYTSDTPLVIMNKTLETSNNGGAGSQFNLNAGAAGAHVFFVNCRIRVFNNSTSTASGTSYSPFTSRDTAITTAGSNVGTLGAFNRPADASTQAASRGIHFFGCQITFESNNTSARVNSAFGRMQDCTIVNNSLLQLRFYFHANADGFNPMLQDGITYDNRILGANNFVNLHNSEYDLLNPEFIGTAPFTNSVGGNTDAAITLSGYANPLPFVSGGNRRYYAIGNFNSNPHGFYSFNAGTRIPVADVNTSVQYNSNPGQDANVRNAVVVEASRYRPTFYSDGARTIPAESIRASITTQHSFATAGNPHSINDTTTAGRRTDYITDTNGQFGDQTIFNPFDGTNSITQVQGLIIPTLRIEGDSGTGGASTSTNVTFQNTVELRGLFHTIDATDGIRTFDITQASELARTDASADIIESESYPINPFLTTALQTGDHLFSVYSDHITDFFPSTGSPTHTAQEIYDLTNLFFWLRSGGFPYTTVASAAANVGINLELDSDRAAAPTFGQGTQTLTFRSAGLIMPVADDNVTGLVALDVNADSQPIRANLTANNINNARFTATAPADVNGMRASVDYDLSGNIQGVVTVAGDGDRFFYVDLENTGPITINRAGTGTVTLLTNQVPSAGSTNESQFSMLTRGTGVEFEATPAQATELTFTIPAGVTTLIEYNTLQYEFIPAVATARDYVISTGTDGDLQYNGTTAVNIGTSAYNRLYSRVIANSVAGVSTPVDLLVMPPIGGLPQVMGAPNVITWTNVVQAEQLLPELEGSPRGVARLDGPTMATGLYNSRIREDYLRAMNNLSLSVDAVRDAAIRDVLIPTADGPNFVGEHLELRRHPVNTQTTQVIVNGSTVGLGNVPLEQEAAAETAPSRLSGDDMHADVTYARRAAGATQTQVQTIVDSAETDITTAIGMLPQIQGATEAQLIAARDIIIANIQADGGLDVTTLRTELDRLFRVPAGGRDGSGNPTATTYPQTLGISPD